MKKRSPRRISSQRNQTPESDRKRAEALVVDLLNIPGPSGQEGAVAQWIAERLRRAGASAEWIRSDRAHRRSPHGGEVGNLVLKLPGTHREARRLFSAHLDTVPLCVGARPVVRGRWIRPADKQTALGADDRAGTAVLLTTALEILERELPHPPLTFLWTVQEELGLLGSRHGSMSLLGRPRMAFNFDGGSYEKLTVGATGGYRMQIDVEGVASHAGCAPEEGVSAITIASLAIARLHREGWLGRIEKGKHHGTSNVGVIQGGEATNVVTPRVHLRAEARSHDPAFRRRIVKTIQEAFRRAAASVRNHDGSGGRVRFAGRLDYEAFRLADDEPCVGLAEEVIRQVGGRPIRAVADGGLDANWLSARGIPTVSLGCGQVGGHKAGERLDLAQYLGACRTALRLACPGG